MVLIKQPRDPASAFPISFFTQGKGKQRPPQGTAESEGLGKVGLAGSGRQQGWGLGLEGLRGVPGVSPRGSSSSGYLGEGGLGGTLS